MAPSIFVNLPVADLERSKRFYGALGATVEPKFTDETAAALVVNDGAFLMLLTRERFADFTRKPVADGSTTEAILAFSADSREEVDRLADAVAGHGATPANEPMEMGFMYGRSFHDPDGHLCEVFWMDPTTAEQSPADMAGEPAAS